MPLALQTDTNPGTAAWDALSGAFGDVTVLSDVSADLDAEATENIAIVTSGAFVKNQPLPLVSTSTRNHYRVLFIGDAEQSVTLTATGGDSIVGEALLDPNFSILAIHDGTDTWYLFGGRVA